MTVSIPDGCLAAAEMGFFAQNAGFEICAASSCNPPASALCASKQAAHDFFLSAGLPQPRDFPDGSEPYIVKPDGGSCGFGMWSTEDFCEAGGAVNADFLVQEELSGPIVSAAVLGAESRWFVCPAVTLRMDDRYDRCGAEYPCAPETDAAVKALALRLAEALALDGILELKAVVQNGEAKIISLNEGAPALASAALWYGTGLDPLSALAALQAGQTPAFSAGKPAAIALEKDGRPCGMRSARPIGPLTQTPEGLSDGRVLLRLLA